MGCNDRPSAVGGGFSSVVLLTLLQDETITATVASDTEWEERVITGVDFRDLMPGTDNITVHHEGYNRVGDFEWQIVIQKRLAQGWGPTNFGANETVVATVGADGYVIAPPYSQSAHMGIESRLLLRYRTASTGSVGDRQTLSVIAAIRPLPR